MHGPKTCARRRAALSAAALLFLTLAGPAAAAQGQVKATPGRAVVAAPAPPAQFVAQAPNKEATVFGVKIRYLEVGSGPQTVVLLHGLGGSTVNWAFNIPALAQKYRVIVPDQVGFGTSDKPLINYRVGTYVDFLDKLLTGLNVERASLVGNSMGGWVASLYALRHPARVERLVLVDAAGYAPPKEFDLNTLAGLNPSTREGMRQLATLVFHNKALFTSDAAVDMMLAQRIAAGDGHTIQSLVESIHRGEDMLDGKLSSLKTPTLIVWGRSDGLTPLAREGERFRKDLPHAEFLVIEEAGHVPQVERAAEFNAALLKFLGQSGK